MDSNKEIKVYGTLVNHTQNYSIMDNDHNDAVVYAKQSYDDRFGVTPNADNFQDVINKRVTAISYADGVTTVKNRAGVPDGNPYMFKVEGASNLHGNTTVDGNVTVNGATALNGTLNVAGKTTLANDLYLSGGNANINGDLTVRDTITGQDLHITDDAAIDGHIDTRSIRTTSDLEVNGTTVLRNNASVGGTLSVGTNAVVDGTLSVGGNTSLNAGLSVAGNTVASNITSSGNISTPNGEMNAKTLHVTENGNIDGTTTTGKLIVTSGGATVTGDSTVTGTFTSSGNVSSPNVNKVVSDVNILNSDKNTQGSVDYKIDQLLQRIMGGEVAVDLDTLHELAAWVTAHQDLYEGLLQTISNIRTDLSTETTNRSNADAALSSRIDTEAAARSAGDQNLASSIATETANRQSAINNIYSVITGNGGLTERIAALENAGYATEGDVMTSIQAAVNNMSINDLKDVNVAGQTSDGAPLVYDAEANKWVAGDADSFGVKYLKNLVDVALSGESSGDILKYNGTKWENSSLTNVLPSAEAGQVLKYDGESWVAEAESGGGGDVTNIYNNYIFGKNVEYVTHPVKFKKVAYK